MQEASPGERLLFHTGEAMQATVVQTKARWSNPPYGGMVYDYVPVKTFAEKGWREGRSVPAPTNLPVYGSLTGFTEPILQRRAMLVLDDYIVIADFMQGTNAHTFESLLHLKGFEDLEAPEKKNSAPRCAMESRSRRQRAIRDGLRLVFRRRARRQPLH